MSTDALIGFLNARLDEWERLGRQALPFHTGSRDEGQPAEHVSWRRSAGSVEYGLRNVATLRTVIKLREQVLDQRFADDQWNTGYDAAMMGVLRQFAVIFSTHPDYRPEWAPGA